MQQEKQVDLGELGVSISGCWWSLIDIVGDVFTRHRRK